jgi:hypothetical protein
MRIYREKGCLLVEWRGTTTYHRLDEPFWLTRLSDALAALDALLLYLFIWPQLQSNAASGAQVVWNIQLPIGIWALLIGFLLSAYALRFLLVPHIRSVRQKEAMRKMLETVKNEAENT